MTRIEINKRTRKKYKLATEPKVNMMYKVLLILPISMLLFAFVCNTPMEIVEGLVKIYEATDVLITDYLQVANTGAAFMNAALVMIINLVLLYCLKLKPNGVIISALFLLGGFAFMGKNLWNIWPFYLGGYAYSRYHNIPYKNVIVINMLSTALSPLSSFVTQAVDTSPLLSFVLTAIISGFVGFIMPTISAHIIGTHMGYSLYNMGTATGFVGIVLYSIMSGLGLESERSSNFYEVRDLKVYVFFILFSLALIGIGYYFNNRSFKGYRKVIKHTGRLVTDIIKQDGFGLSLINMGLLGILCIIYIEAVGGVLNGPVIAAMLTVIGFGGFGKHPRNVTPIILGVTLGMIFMGKEGSTTILIISALFGTTLAPIAGEYGVLWGMLAGMIHSALVLNIGDIHGGIVLYNNGLSGGIIAMLLIPLIDAFKREKHNET
ncbi:MAG: DUF1576 domain-containing protein [Cellulosilyticaceae bacterium]